MTADLVGSSEVISKLRDQIARIAKTESWVLITGEPGSGKGVVANRVCSGHPAGITAVRNRSAATTSFAERIAEFD